MKNRYAILFTSAALALYALAAFPLAVLRWEFKSDAWELAGSYPSLFVFPALVLPVVLWRLFNPVKACIELNKFIVPGKIWLRRLLFGGAPVLALAGSIAAVFIEDQGETMAVWEVAPETHLAPGANGAPPMLINAGTTSAPVSLTSYRLLKATSRHLQIEDPGSTDTNAASYVRSGRKIFQDSLQRSNLGPNNVQSSRTRAFYLLAVFATFLAIFVTLALVAVFSALFLTQPHLPGVREACFDLTLAVSCFLLWVPMRVVTLELKQDIYAEVSASNEILVICLIFLATAGIAASWFQKHNETFIGVFSLAGLLASGSASVFASDALVQIFSEPRFYFAFVIIALFPILWLILYNQFRNSPLTEIQPRMDDKK